MAAPVRHGVELDAVGELHVVLSLEPGSLLDSLIQSSLLAVLVGLARLDRAVVAEFVLFVAGHAGGCGSAPSSLATADGALGAVVGGGNRGGTVGAGRGRNGEECRYRISEGGPMSLVMCVVGV